MNRSLRFVLLCSLLSATPGLIRAAQFKFGDQTFTVPEGFEVERVAGPPLVDRPVTADFDEEGRLYVTDSSGSNEKPDKQLQQKPHRIVRLQDTDGNGFFDKSTLFADKMMFPEGCLWFEGSLYVAAPPSIWKLTDSDHDNVVDRREEWFQGKTLTGCANDLHGPYRGPDGWLYWCKGAFATQTYPVPGKSPLTTRAAHIFRAHPDGSGIEAVLTGGMDNPVSVTFTPEGERILTGTFFVHPGGGQRDGLIHAIYGGVYGKDHDVLEGHKRTGDLMPIMTHHGPSASCFVTRYESGAFGNEYRDNLFACLFNLHKVTRHVLVPSGATYTTKDEDFLVSDNTDFHPTQALEDADGSLLVVDTGGWYKICCPTSQLWKPDMLGAIYRVRRTGASKVEDPRGLRIAWREAAPATLVALLGDSRPFVQQRAIQQLGRTPASVPTLRDVIKNGSVQARRNAIWALTRIQGEEARAVVRLALQDADPSVRHTASHGVSVWRDHAALPALLEELQSGLPALQRVAAEALGRIGDRTAVPQLLQAASGPQDRVLEHSLIYALIEIDDREAVEKVLAESTTPVSAKHAGLVALDQMDGGGLEPDRIVPLLASSEPVLKQTASWIVGHHPEWAGALAGFFRERLTAASLSAPDRTELEQNLSGFARDEAIQNLLAAALEDKSFPMDSRLTALHAMAQASLKQAPLSWAEGLVSIFKNNDGALVPAAVATARALNLPAMAPAELIDGLRSIGTDSSRPLEVRLEALAAIPGGLSPVEPGTFEFLRSSLDAAKPVLIRSTAAGVLAKARLTSDQLLALTEDVKKAGPLEVPRLLGAFEKGPTETVGLKLVAALKDSPGLAALRADTLRSRLTNFPAVVQHEGEKLVALLNVDGDRQKVHLDELLTALSEGDVRRGQAVFNSQKAACSTCHAIGYLGGNVGPDLTRIGSVRTERDLLESIVYPSASFVRSYEPVLVTTKSGDDFNGVIRKDTAEQLILATGPGAEVRIARSDVVDMRPGTVSVMPGGLDELLSRQELADLVTFLKNTKW